MAGEEPDVTPSQISRSVSQVNLPVIPEIGDASKALQLQNKRNRNQTNDLNAGRGSAEYEVGDPNSSAHLNGSQEEKVQQIMKKSPYNFSIQQGPPSGASIVSKSQEMSQAMKILKDPQLTYDKRIQQIMDQQLQSISPKYASDKHSDEGEIATHISGHSNITGKKSISTSQPNLSKIAKSNLQKTVDYQQKMLARVNFLKKEEKKYLSKIEQGRRDVEKSAKLKDDRIQILKDKIMYERRDRKELETKIDQSRQQREEKQASKLKRAYEAMLKFESERKLEREKRDEMEKERRDFKMEQYAKNFNQADRIRQDQKALKQAQFFHGQLKQMNHKQNKDSKVIEMSEKVTVLGKEIEDLERMEQFALENLQKSINQHN